MTDNTTFGADNRPPFAQLPDWVVLADISNNAKVLYWHLAMHVNFQRGDRAAWPGRATLARRMGYSRADKVDPFIAELVKIKALKKVKRQRADGGDASNHYLVNFLTPEGHPGPASLTEAYLADRAVDAPAGQTPAPKSGPGSKQGKPNVPAPRTPAPDSGLGGSPETRAGGAPDSGRGEPRNEGPNKKKENQTKLNETKTLPPTPRAAEPARAAATAGQDGGKDLPDQKDELELLVDEVKAARPAWSRGAIRSALQHPDVLDRPQNLWRPAFLAVAADKATQSPGRLAADGPWWATAAAAVNVRPAAPPKCDTCNPFRRIEDEHGNDGGPCPTCHPSITDA